MWRTNDKNYGFWECSRCRHEAYWDTDYGQQLFDYCPYCGLKQKEQCKKSEKFQNYAMPEFERELNG